MKSLLNLSFRYKIPLWGSALIVATALGMSVSIMLWAYDDLKRDMLSGSANLGRTLAKTVFPAMLHDDVWRAFEIINAPLHGAGADNPVQPEAILVLDAALQVYVSTQPQTLPLLAKLRRFSGEHAALADRIEAMRGPESETIDLPGARRIYVVTPIADEGARLGTLVIAHSRDIFLPRFLDMAGRGSLMGLLVLAVLLPINWYWGQRMAVPLVELATRMEQLGARVPEDLDPGMYEYRDELGRLFEAYSRTVKELHGKAALEREMLRSERLAAVGRLAAGMAHEINNPLGGMLTAIDTLKCRTDVDARTMKTISLIERGLTQIQETVGALLVEARLKSRNLSSQDIDDIGTLVNPLANKKSVRITCTNTIAAEVALPATLVRQTLINLLLNAIQAAADYGEVTCTAEVMDSELRLAVTNDGKLLSPEQMERLFEPFSPLSTTGHGLGLWVTYQIVQQLGGRIEAQRDGDRMRFEVRIPIEEIS